MTVASMVTFSDEFTFQPKSGRKAGDGRDIGEYPFYTSSSTQRKQSDSFDYEGPSLVFGTGGSASVHFCQGKFSCSNDCLVVKPRQGSGTYAKYVYYYLYSNLHLLEQGFRGAGLKHVSKRFIQALNIPRPDLRSQQTAVNIFDRFAQAQLQRQRSIILIDEFVYSSYHALFSSRQQRSRHNSRVRLGSLLADRPGSIRTGPFGSQLLHSEFTQTGVPVLGIDNVVTNRFKWAKKRFLPEEKYRQFERFRVFPGDVIVTIMGTVGRVCVVPENIPVCMSTKHLCVMSFDREKVSPVYVWATIIHDSRVRSQAVKYSGGAIMEGWNIGVLRDISIDLPPLVEQKRFAEIVMRAESLMHKAEESETEIESLAKSLRKHVFS